MSTFTKDPDALLDYRVDWATWLGNDTITASQWFTSDAALVVDSDTFDTTSATVWLRGGVNRAKYTATNRVTTAAGRTDDRTITIKIAEK